MAWAEMALNRRDFWIHLTGVVLNGLGWLAFAYNFIKIHTTLRTSPAMAAGVTTRLFDVADLVALLVESEAKKAA